QQAALGNNSAVLDYLRGVRTNEIDSLGKGTYRTRDNVLGDVIDASPTWVGAPGGGYASAWTDRLNPSDKLLENSAKTSFATFQSNEKTRQNVVYAGANDGFLHAFRSKAADNTGVNDGIEVFAYMPSAVVQTIHKVTTITNADGTTSTDSTLDFTSPQYTHSYFVDATPATGDIFYDGTWHTWLVGGLGAGAPGVYILDVTDPSTFSEAADQAKAMVIGDWVAGPDKNADGSATGAISCLNNGQTNNANCGLNLGNVTDIPLIRRFHNGTWGVIFGNGAGSYNGDAGIFILTIDPQSLAKTWYYLSTGATGSNGIAATAASDFDGDRITDYVYAGDIKGNVWRFDLTSSNPTDWAASATALFSTGGQPITTAPVVANGVVGGYKRVMVAVGTGQRTPMSASNPVTYLKTAQNIYGVWDW